MTDHQPPMYPAQPPYGPDPSGGFYLNQMAPPPPKKGWPTSAIVIVITLGFATLVSFGAAAAAAGDPQAAASTRPTATATVTVTRTVTATPAAPPTTAAPAGPLTSFKDGTYEIGNAPGLIAPGKYKTTVPTDSSNCYWERLRGLSGQFSDIIANDNVGPGTPAVVSIAATDKGFTSRGCGTWQKA